MASRSTTHILLFLFLSRATKRGFSNAWTKTRPYALFLVLVGIAIIKQNREKEQEYISKKAFFTLRNVVFFFPYGNSFFRQPFCGMWAIEFVSRQKNTQQWRSASPALEVAWRKPYFAYL